LAGDAIAAAGRDVSSEATLILWNPLNCGLFLA